MENFIICAMPFILGYAVKAFSNGYKDGLNN